MSGWTELFLGTIAVATLAIAVVHIAVLVAAGMAARRLGRFIDQMDRDLKPILAHINAVARDAARAAAIAGAQVERADRLFADIALRIEQALTSIQASLLAPAREGRALIKAFWAGLRALRELRDQARTRQGRSEDEDALFI